jgi:hypothetical protein
MPNTSPPKTLVTGAVIVGLVQRFIGDVYVYGAEGPNTFDCSGLVQYTFGKAGIKLPRTAEAQYAATTPITSGQLLPGDLVFSAGSDGTTSHPGHVGIYVGRPNGTPTVVEAPHTGALVRYTPLARFDASGYRRVSGVSTSGTDAADAGFTIPGLGDVTGGLGDVAGGLLSIPKDIIGFFGKATDDLTSLGKFFWAFTQPSTWVRIGAGYLGTICLLAGIVFLIMAGVQVS